ncbi:ABC transporter ATP-binding protein [Rossellomorea aquimaris]|uniref:ABC transporter ATP-binding protein n=1 Tax=Rossellomorea aquimaris TaxID=189382 RepID=UPI001CD34127|nr:ABC transporter ATP-binding protein [Rossellomorea aquimaris]MCA1055738.1 ABC transporter ATP-binding protein [Rossellomorea aquimaris]
MNVVECTGLTKQYGLHKALDELTFTLTENKITGLIGRNGAGKTTLLKIIAGFLRNSSGEVRVFSEVPFNHLKVSANTIFIDNEMSFSNGLTLWELLETAGRFYPNWNGELAERLFSYFSFKKDQYHGNLSKGMRSTFNMIIGLSARCPLTIFDEPTSGMDAATRKDFYRALLKEYIAYPRTIILSSHLLTEVEDLLEEVLLIKSGKKCLHLGIEELKEYAIGVRGKTDAVHNWMGDIEPIHTQDFGSGLTYAVLKNDYGVTGLQEGKEHGLEFSPVSAEDLCTYLTRPSKGGIDDVFIRG